MSENEDHSELAQTTEFNYQTFADPTWGGEQLRKISLFQAFSDQELVDLYRLGEVRRVNAKSNIVIEGEQTRGLYLLLKGTVSVYKTDKSSSTMIRLAYLDEGSAFGELSLFDEAPRSATITGESNCDVFYLDIAPFEKFLDEMGDDLKVRFYKKCAEDMVERFRKQNSDYIISQKLLWKYALRKDE